MASYKTSAQQPPLPRAHIDRRGSVEQNCRNDRNGTRAESAALTHCTVRAGVEEGGRDESPFNFDSARRRVNAIQGATSKKRLGLENVPSSVNNTFRRHALFVRNKCHSSPTATKLHMPRLLFFGLARAGFIRGVLYFSRPFAGSWSADCTFGGACIKDDRPRRFTIWFCS